VTMFDEKIQEELAKPIDGRRVKQREGPGGKRLDYLEQHDVRRRLNEIFGFGGWGFDLESVKQVGDGSEYLATGRLCVGDVSWGDIGHGASRGGTDHDQAAKTAVSDCLKRCAVNLGDQFGLSLYSDSPPPAPAVEPTKPVLKMADALKTIDDMSEEDDASVQLLKVAAHAKWGIESFELGPELDEATRLVSEVMYELFEMNHSTGNRAGPPAVLEAWRKFWPELSE
jgi:hypothetical protein